MFKWFNKKNKSEEATEDQKEIDQEQGDSSLEDPKNDYEKKEDLEEKVKEDQGSKENKEVVDLKDEKVEVLQDEEELESLEDNLEETDELKEEDNLGFFGKLVSGLSKTRKEMSNKIDSIISSYKKIDEELFDDLEEALVTADVGVATTMTLIDNLRVRIKEERVSDPLKVKELLKNEMKKLMKESVEDNSLKTEPSPSVILVVGVNGVGKTTTIGKLAYKFKNQGKKVLIPHWIYCSILVIALWQQP